MNLEYWKELDLHECTTFDEYLRERIRRGLRAGYNQLDLQIHLQKQFGAVFDQYVRNLAIGERTEQEEEDRPLRLKEDWSIYQGNKK